MAKQLNVNLAFTADANKAKKEVQDLQKILSELINNTSKNHPLGLSKEINDAISSASELKAILSSATSSTGKIDLGQLNQALSKSNKQLIDYAQDLKALGPQGTQAFAAIARSISSAEVPLKQTNNLLSEFATTLKNTARWQISSSILHGFMGAIQSAYGYAQDLNQSLNNIRIVTGYSNDEMAKFAESANKAAQSLNTTTTNYTDAALIYYQQGIRDEEEIADRTETTIKLANVSRQSAEEVSSQMTAIWNNFDDGSKSLEYYADVITALGANTASSSQEIAKGMQQFAAVADTVGLSYEYAAASLATIVATTRQSESTVGNSLRTIFSRLEGLKLGDTLEDGTDLNKYSAALATIGVNIKDASGSLKDMDTILEETASKWDQLDKAQKVAFATTVGGVRQYTNLIALLDNWDMVQENIGIAKGSEGTLQEQADIYAESWEAASKRVQASLQGIYQDLLDDDFFIKSLDFIAELIQGIDSFIDAIGGLKTILPAIASILMSTFGEDISNSINNLFYNIKLSSEAGIQEIINRRKEANQALREITESDSASDAATSAISQQQADLSDALIEKTVQLQREGGQINEIDLERVQHLMDINASLGEEYSILVKNKEEQEAILNTLIRQASYQVRKNANGSPEEKKGAQENFENEVNQAKELQTAYQILNKVKEQYDNIAQKVNKNTITEAEGLKEVKEYTEAFKNSLNTTGAVGETALGKIIIALDNCSIEGADFKTVIHSIETEANAVGDNAYDAFVQVESVMSSANIEGKEASNIIKGIMSSSDQLANRAFQQTEGFARNTANFERTSAAINNMGNKIPTIADGLSQSGKAATNFAMALGSAAAFGSNLFDENVSGVQKFISAIMMLTSVVRAYNTIREAQKTLDEAITALKERDNAITLGTIIMEKAHNITSAAYNAILKAKAVIMGQDTVITTANTAAVTANAAAWYAHPVIAILAIAIMGVVAALNAWNTAIEKNSERLKESANKSKEIADATNEEIDNNRKLISSMSDLLEKYNNGEDVKTDLDEVTRSLAEAYNLEGDAIAKLSGKYDDYQTVLNKAYAAQEKQLKDALGNEKTAAQHQAQVVLDSARKGQGYQVGNNYNLDFNGGANQDKLIDILGQNVSSGSIGMGGGGLTHKTFSIDIDINNPEAIVDLYHDLLSAQQAMEALGDPQLNNYDTYQQISDWLDKMGEDIKEYEAHLEKIKEYSIQLGELDGMTMSEKDVKSLSDYNKWIDEISQGLKKLDSEITDTEIDEVIKKIVGESINPDLSKFYDYSNAIKDIIALNDKIPEDGLQKLFESELYDEAVIGIVDWQNQTESSYEAACAAAQEYINILKKVNGSSEEGDSIEKAISDYGSGLTKSNTSKLAEDINWGQKEDLENGKQEIIKFVDFIHMKKDEQKQYLQDLLDSSNETEIENIKLANEALEAKNQELKQANEKIGAEAAAQAREVAQTIEYYRSQIEKNGSLTDQEALDLRNKTGVSIGKTHNNLEDFDNLSEEKYNNAKNVADIYDKNTEAINENTDAISANETRTAELGIQQAYNCTTLDQLNKKLQEGKITQEDYNTTIDSVIGTELSSMKISEEAFNQHVKTIQKNVSALAENENAAKQLALANLKVQQGIKELGKNIDTYTKNIVKDKEDTLDYAESMSSVREVMSQILGIAKEDISENFITDNLEDIKLAANDDEEALERLREAANRKIVCDIEIDNDGITSQIDEVLNNLEAEDLREIEIGTSIDSVAALNDFTQLLNDMAVQAMVEGQDISDQLTDALNSINFDPKIDYDELQLGDADTAESETTGYVTIPTIHTTADGTIESSTTQIPVSTYQQAVEQGLTTIKVPRINGKGTTSKGGVNSGASAGHKGRGGGGGRRGGGGRGREFRKIDRTEKDEKQKKKAEDEIERYHKVRNELQDIEKELSLIGKAKDRAFGRNKIRQIDAETASLKKQSETQKKYLSEIQGWLEKDNAKAKEFGFEINGEGLVTNYEENMKKLIDKVNGDYDDYIAKLNALEDAYNAAGVDDEDSKKKLEDDKKALAKEWEANQKYYEDAKEALSKQEETHDLLIEQQEALQDMLNNIYDNGITKITYVVELKVDVADRDIALLQDYLEDIGDKADGACDAIANFGNQLEKVLEKTDAYTQGVADILQHADADEDLIDSILNHTFDENDWDEVLSIGQDGKGLNEEEIQYLKDAADALLSHNQELRELREQALKKTSEAFEEFNEQLDRGIVKIEHLTTVTQTYRDVLDIVGKDVLDRNGKLTDALNKQTYNIQRNHTHALQSQLDFIDTALEKAKGLYDEAVQNGYNQKTLESLKADVEKYEDERQATYEEWLDSWKEECQIAKDYYEDTLNQILQDFEDAVAGQFKNLSGLSEEFARKNEIADIYVEDYEKIYQLSKLNRDINKSLDDSTTLASKAKLRDIQKEINDLQESGVEVSQYDLDVLRKKYEMALAYEQWQDAQNAKTVVRMQRDNEGNYGYVYTADQADVEAAEQNYEDKLHEMQVLNAEYIQSLQEQIIQAQQDCADALANLRAEDFASYEEYQDAVEQIRKDYTKRVETLSQQMGNAMDNNRTLYEQDWTAYSQATGYKISADEDYIDKFNETVYSQLTGFQTMEEAQNAFVEAVNDASDLAAQNWEDWYVRTNTALDDAGMSMQNYADEVGDTVEQLGEEAERAEEDVWNMSEEFSDAYSTISDTVGDFLDEYSNYIDSMIDANQALIDSINQVIRAYAELHGLEDDDEDDEVRKSEDLEWQEQKDANGVSTGWKVYDKKNKKYLTGKNKIAWAGDDYIQGYTADYDIDEQGNVKQQSENNTLGSGFFGTNFTEEQKAKLRKPTIINAEINMTDDEKKYGPSANILSENKVKNTVFEGLNDFFSGKPIGGASGMYTGDWGDNSGKIAVLHRKELVLNANDTENILSAVDMIRSISKTIDLNAIAAGSIFASPNSAYKSSFGSRDSLEQNVHIQAEFPNVSDHNEIEEALNNLVERAAQFAGRKNL